jgi:2'-5' RNA ligase
MSDLDRAIAIDIALEPDAGMTAHAIAVNARLRSQFPSGFELGETHKPHITVLQRFVDGNALDQVTTAARSVIADEHIPSWKLTAVDHNYIAIPPVGVTTIAIAPTDELHRLQQRLIDALAPYTVHSGTTAAFVSSVEGTDIQDELISYVTDFVSRSSGDHFHPHVTTGVATVEYLDQMVQERFEPFVFTIVGATLYQLGTYGTAQKRLGTLT